MKARIAEITIWIGENGDKVAFRRTEKSESMEKMSMAELQEIVCCGLRTRFWRWLLASANSHFYEDALLENWLEEKLEEWRVKYGTIE